MEWTCLLTQSILQLFRHIWTSNIWFETLFQSDWHTWTHGKHIEMESHGSNCPRHIELLSILWQRSVHCLTDASCVLCWQSTSVRHKTSARRLKEGSIHFSPKFCRNRVDRVGQPEKFGSTSSRLRYNSFRVVDLPSSAPINPTIPENTSLDQLPVCAETQTRQTTFLFIVETCKWETIR